MLDQKIIALLNQQINTEFYSAYLYLAFANEAMQQGLDGFAHWYQIQAQEERDHALLFYQYLHNNQSAATFTAIKTPEVEKTDIDSILKAGLKHEQYNTQQIYHIYAAAQEIKDFRTIQFLDWFIREQGEEENSANDLITKMELFGHDAKGLYLLNTELKTRVYAAPTLTL